MALSKDLAYRVEAPQGEVLSHDARHAFDALLRAHRPTSTTISVAHSLLAPLAEICDWRDEKFALFMAARTGSFKTAWSLVLMCLYGKFNNEEKMLKFGMGGTANALMSYAADACDVPLLIDNFKPGTGNGQKDAQTLIHGVIEGGEKRRLNRDGTRRDGKDIHCWPVFTGEDVLDDAASIARMVIVSLRWDGGENPALTEVQGMAHVLPQVGGAWLSWLMQDSARHIARTIGLQFNQRRTKWNLYLRQHHADMVNSSRVASSLALLECTWEIALRCPALEPVLAPYTADFEKGLIEAASGMGGYAAQTHEANRYIAAIRAMLLSGKAYLADRLQDPDKDDRRTFIGWEDEKYVYLQPDVAYREVLEFLRSQGGLNGLGMNTIHRQLDQFGHLAKRDGKQLTARKRVGLESRMHRLLWIERDKIYDTSDEGDEEED